MGKFELFGGGVPDKVVIEGYLSHFAVDAELDDVFLVRSGFLSHEAGFDSFGEFSKSCNS